MTKANHADSVLEVACASGFGSEYLARNFLKKGGRLVSCDASGDSITRMKKRFSDSKFTDLKNTKVNFDTATDFCKDGNKMCGLTQAKEG